MGAAHSMRTIGYLMLDAIGKKEKSWRSARQVMDFLGLGYSVVVSLRLHTSLSRLDADTESHDEYEQLPGEPRESEMQSYLRSVSSKALSSDSRDEVLHSLMGSDSALEQLIRRLHSFPLEVVLNFHDGAPSSMAHKGFTVSELMTLVQLNVIVIAKLLVTKTDTGEEIAAEQDLSSGQWHIFFTMLGLALSLDHNSLVVVDEPENSLHPEWQWRYIDLLERVMSGSTGCHVVIATHSPLIASGVKEGAGNVVRLVPSVDGPIGIAVKQEELTFGWDAGDVYRKTFEMESTRALSFVDTADRALALVRDGKDKSQEFRVIASELANTAQSLPEEDTMRSVINAITKIAEGEKA
ncbi:hypothetical protein A6V36_20485 [Paraburkholderia ginsengiterrae]|uniref:ATPase AAA-type core domain-containing protein n=3 Tax=Paraburkholderia ginsengiterrae TaxID=1462993 RepID=A0A1A9NCU7_9BURK|nr:hypothetical protein A6V36_20485 [Paraburkholderia ginsengiterrae]OAJ64413.1 hypothetical protein A6V37_19510 [Paraburkholderia ginsengiterrae]